MVWTTKAQVPYRVLNFLTSYINYGGRVTDYIDLRTIDVIMRTFYTPGVSRGKTKGVASM